MREPLLGSTSSTLPYYNTEKSRRSLNIIICRFWRKMPRLLRVLVVLLCFITIFEIYVLSTGNDSYSEAREKAEMQEQIDNQNVLQQAKQDVDVPGVENSIRKDSAAEAVADKPQPKSNIPRFTGPTNDRQRAVVEAFKHAWNGYKKFAWGKDNLKPVSQSSSTWFDTALTIVDGIDTAVIMGLTKEVDEATEWVRTSLNFDKDRYVNFFEASIRVLGGMLSAYHLTGEKVFLERAQDVAGRLSGAWKHSKSAVPLSDVNLLSRNAKNPSWSEESSLSEVTTVQLEYRDLSRLIGDASFESVAFNTSLHVHSIGCAKHGGLCDMFINTRTGAFKAGSTITFGARADSYYEYLIKQYLQTGKTVAWLKDDYEQAMTSMTERLVKKSQPHGYSFVGELLGGTTFSPKMDHLACFISGSLVLGHLYAGMPKEHLTLAEDIGFTCKQMYETATGLAPEIVHFNLDEAQTEDVIIKPLDSHCLLRPEAIEAWFYLYRATGDKKYQEWGWKAFEAMEKYARIATGGYSSVNNVRTTNVAYKDMMESFFLAETLKYLYLLLADDQSILPLDEWVFNTEGHPLPIRKS